MSDAATIERAEVEAEADETKEEPNDGAATEKAAESTAEAEGEKEEETKVEAKDEAASMQVDEETAKEHEKEKEPEKPSELEEDAPEDGRARLTGAVTFNTEDTTLNAMPTCENKLLLHMADGGFQHLIAGARANVGIKAGRYMFELVILGNPPLPQQGAPIMPPKAPSQLVRVGFAAAGSSLILGESEDAVCFDADGIYHHGKEKKRVSQKFIRDQVVGVLLNMDGTSANAYTVSIFRDGVRMADPQPLPEALRTQALFPAVSYKGAMLRLNFAGQPIKPLPFTCRMIQDIAEADSERALAVEPENGRYEVIFPVALPDEGCFEWVDQFLAKNPKYVELSHRTIIDWAIKSGLWRKGVSLNKGCNDKPEMGFGIPQLDDMSTLRLLASLAPALPRNFLVAEVKGNLMPEMRKAIISRFTGFTKTACVAMGEPTMEYKEATQARMLQEKRHQAEIELRKKKHEAELKKMIDARKAGKAPDEEPEVEEFDMDVSVELTEEERQMVHPKKSMTDLLPLDLGKCFHRFSIPDVEEGFDNIRYEWANQEASKEYLSSWVLKRKATQRIEDIQPGKFFREKSTEWQKASLEFKKKQMEWKKVIDQLQEWKSAGKAKGSDPKKAEDDKPTDIDPDELDVFTVENVNDIGSGEPLYSNFEYEDWCLLAFRIELFLLVHGFRLDVDDVERQTFHESHLPFYYNRYWKKALDPKMYNRGTTSDIVALLKDAIEIDTDSGMLEVKVSEDQTFDHFVKLAEEHRRERQRRLDAGDETAELKFRKLTPVPPAKAPVLNAAKAGQKTVIAGHRPVFQVAMNPLLKPVVVNPVRFANVAKAGPIKLGLTIPPRAQSSGPLKAGLIKPGTSSTQPVQGVKRPGLSIPNIAGVTQPATKVARTSFGGGAKW